MDAKIQSYKRRFPTVKKLVVVENPKGSNRRFKATFELNGSSSTIQFGTSYDTYYDGASKTKRDSYRARASKIKNKDGKYTYMIPGTANSLAYWLLW